MAAVGVLWLLAATAAVCSGRLVVVNSGVEVTRGRSAFVTEKELQIGVEPSADCKVEVVMNEPLTQRVGRLTPQVRTRSVGMFRQWTGTDADTALLFAGVRLQLPPGPGDVRPQWQSSAGRGRSDAASLQVSPHQWQRKSHRPQPQNPRWPPSFQVFFSH